MHNFKLPESVSKAVNILEKNGYKAHLVGGCVRDWAMGSVPHDFDIATNALPCDIISLFKSYRIVETGVKHGTVTVIIDNESLEITTYRIDGEYEDSRHPKNVSFTDDLYLDLSRRDFTVNAMAYNPSAGITDIFSGLVHLREKKIVCVGDPYKRFEEDGLRILRALRFASVLSFDIEKNTASAIFHEKYRLRFISIERIFSEIKKFLCGNGCEKLLRKFSSVILECVPGISEKALLKCADIIDLTVNDPCVRLSLILIVNSYNKSEKDCKSTAIETMKHLKASRREIIRTATLAENFRTDLPINIPQIKRLAGQLDEEDIYAGISIRKALGDKETYNFLYKYKAVLKSHTCLKISELDINGSDIKNTFNISGPAIGSMLRYLLDLVIDEKVKNNKEALMEAINKKLSLD